MSQETLSITAIIELMGHQKMAGTVTEFALAGDSFVRVTVPETKEQPTFDRLLNPAAIYAINPVDEDTMKAKAQVLRVTPIDQWDIKELLSRNEDLRRKLLTPSEPTDLSGDWNDGDFHED